MGIGEKEKTELDRTLKELNLSNEVRRVGQENKCWVFGLSLQARGTCFQSGVCRN
jgi:hypothetical protein